MGGRIDATNVLARPELAVLTAVSFDHTAVLGSSLAAIAREKSGILKPGWIWQYLFLSRLRFGHSVLEQAAKVTDSRLWDAGRNPAGRRVGQPGRDPLAGAGEAVPPAAGGAASDRKSPHGVEGPANPAGAGMGSAVACGTGGIFPRTASCPFGTVRDNAAVSSGLRAQSCRGRGAGGVCLPYLPGRRVAGVVGMLRDKPCAAVMDILSPCFSDLFAVTPDSPRALPDRELAAFWRGETPPHLCGGNLAGALRQAAACVGETGAVCGMRFPVFGRASPPIAMGTGKVCRKNYRPPRCDKIIGRDRVSL